VLLLLQLHATLLLLLTHCAALLAALLLLPLTHCTALVSALLLLLLLLLLVPVLRVIVVVVVVLLLLPWCYGSFQPKGRRFQVAGKVISVAGPYNAGLCY